MTAESDVRETALKMLAKRDYSAYELTEKLLSHDYDETDAEDAVSWLTELRYIDDEKYARGLMARCVAKNYGYDRCMRDMRRRGIDADIIDRVLDDYPESTDMLYMLVNRLSNGQEIDYKLRGRITASLLRRGFDMDEIRAAIDNFECD